MTSRKTYTRLAVTLFASVLLVVGRSAVVQAQDPSGGFPDQPPADFQPPEGFQLPDGVSLEDLQNNAVASPSSEISALGSVEAKAVVSLAFQTSGKVNALYVDVGDYVNEGDVLADLDNTDDWNTYHQAQLNLESAQLSYDDLLSPPTETDLEVARANVASAQASYSSIANGSDTQVEQAQQQYDDAQQNLETLQQQRAFTGGSEAQIDQLEARIGAASFNAEIARLKLEDAQSSSNTSNSLWSASIRIQQAQLSLDQLQAGPTQAQLDNAQIAIERAQLSLQQAQTALEESQLVAPRSGYVTALNIAEGDNVSPSTVALELADLSGYQMTVPVNELDVGRVSIGQSAVVQLDAITGDLSGTVERIGWLSSTSNDGIVTYDVQIALDTTDARVRLGMTGEVTINTENAR